ncbi:MAG: cation transporter [Nitrospina sp.]|nr:MAG: cation transporter [Nitrospina sp.]
MDKNLTSREVTKVILVGAAWNLFLAVIKIAGGIFGKSAAMMADGVHSLSDLLTDGVVLFTYRIGQMPADENHPYGHGRAETIGATLIGSIIILAGLGLVFEAWQTISQGSENVPEVWAMAAAAVSILINEGLFHYTRSAGEKSHSPSLMANAWHHRSDAFSSIAALVGIGGAIAGVPIMDPLAAVVVAIMVGKVGYNIAFSGLSDLMDTGLSEKITREIESSIDNIPGVVRSHNLRTRKIGGEIMMDVHILVDRQASVTEGHTVAESVRRQLIKSFDNVRDVLVHVDTEDDADFEPLYWTNREELQRQAEPIIASLDGIKALTRLHTHHYNGEITLEVFVKLEDGMNTDQTRQVIHSLKSRLEDLDHVDEVNVFIDMN